MVARLLKWGWVYVLFLVGSLLCDRNLVLAQTFDPSGGVCNTENHGECLADSEGSIHRIDKNRPLRPSDLPRPRIFEGFHRNTTLNIADRELTVLQGSILQQGHIQISTGSSVSPRSELAVLPGLIPRSVVAEILTLLRGDENADVADGRTTIELDKDPDSVDGMTSQEIFLDNESLRSGQTSKRWIEDMQSRAELRQKLRALTDPYAYQVLIPFLQEWYGTEICGREGRKCTPCYSLIRRYRAGERQSHAPHNDSHSFVTVVVSLTDYGDEYTGGLYVSTKNSERNYVKLNRGDAVAHQGDLHHGVRVLDERNDGGPSERWSWILWFRDSDTCQDHASEWHRECAHKGNPTCMYLQASSSRDSPRDVISWNQKASDSGHAQASVKLAYAYLKVLPSDFVEFNITKARELFGQAILSSNEPDGHYGMAALYLNQVRSIILGQPDNESKQKMAIEAQNSPLVAKAIEHLEEAARGGHVFAMFNLGICHTFGYASKDNSVDYDLATEWFEASGLPEGLFAKAMYLKAIGNHVEADIYREKAATLGFGTPWRKDARERTGSGGSHGPKLNLDWPPLPGGVMPPEW